MDRIGSDFEASILSLNISERPDLVLTVGSVTLSVRPWIVPWTAVMARV